VNEKYELTEEFKEIETLREGWLQKIKVYRIRALRAFADVKIGDLGGFVETKQNLSNMGNAWVYGNAEVYGNAKVCNNARVYDNAKVCNNARVYDNAWVCGNAEVCGDAKVCNNARVYDNAWVCGNAKVYGNAEVCGDAKVCDNANIFWCSSIGSRHATTTMFRNKDNGITVTCGCFMGTLEEFAERVEKEHGENIFGKEYKLLIELAKIHFGLQDETKGEEENGI
jgi:carbonic anhydrase/acetyltransferase-like protein (isoleucine patch superfamily)